MRVAALCDIHGNLPALEAVLHEVRAAGTDAVVVGGYVLPGPMPRETLACLTALDLPVEFIHGNGDRVVAACLAGGDITEVPEAFRDSIAWTAQQLDARAKPDARLEPMLAGVESAVVVCGHTHLQFDRLVAKHRIINAGSVGMPFAGRRAPTG